MEASTFSSRKPRSPHNSAALDTVDRPRNTFAEMALFEVEKESKRVSPIGPSTFPGLKLWERQDLEAWVLSSPELAGGDFDVVSSEYDRFDKTSERLDVLGIVKTGAGQGRLVVIELKRDGASTTVDLQAIKYAAYVAAAQFADVVEMYSRYHEVTEEAAEAKLLELLGGSEEETPIIDDTPRIVLLAGEFRPEVTTTVLWLIDNFGMDIRCVRVQPFAVGERILVNSEVIIPLPEAEQYRLGVRRKRQEVKREQEQRARARRLLPQLIEAGALEIGQKLYFRKEAVPAGAEPAWRKGHPLYTAELIAAEGNRTLEWLDPDSGEFRQESASRVTAILLHRLGVKTGDISSAGVNGMIYWTIDGTISLQELGKDIGVLEGASRSVDRNLLRKVCAEIPRGRWTTYGDLAEAIGVPGAAQSIASVIASDTAVENAHRVLRATGEISPGWEASDGSGPEAARAQLREEGLPFEESGRAAAAARWTPPIAAS
jgi:alkylated DNA nucleotide flippase Atl1